MHFLCWILLFGPLGTHASCDRALTRSDGDSIYWRDEAPFVNRAPKRGDKASLVQFFGSESEFRTIKGKDYLSVQQRPVQIDGVTYQDFWRYRGPGRKDDFVLLYGVRKATFVFPIDSDFPGLVITLTHYLSRNGAQRALEHPEYMVLEFGDRMSPALYTDPDIRVRTVVAAQPEIQQILGFMRESPAAMYENPKWLGQIAQSKSRLAKPGSEIFEGDSRIWSVTVSQAFRHSLPRFEGRLFD